MRALSIFLLCLSIFANPVINEIYDNPNGGASDIPGDDSNEFIELYNCGDEAVDLAGWIIDIAGTTDDIQLFDDPSGFNDPDAILDNTTLLPGEFALILDPEYVDPLNDQPFDIPEGTIVLTIGNTTFGSGSITGGSTVILMNPEGIAIDSMMFLGDISHSEGQSVERLEACAPSTLENWSAADMDISPLGSTPGTYNTVSEVPNDLAIDSSYVEGSTFYAVVGNKGMEVPGTATLSVYRDLDNDNVGDPEELVSTTELSVDDRETVSVPFSPPSDITYILGILSGDQQPANNFSKALYVPSTIEEPLIITEFMNKPSDGMPEWVEFYNNTTETINLNGWSLGDGDDQKEIDEDVIVAPGEFVVLAENEVVIDDTCSGILYMMDSWEALNNTDDVIVLMDSYGFERVRLAYLEDWTSQCLDYDVSQELVSMDADFTDPDSWWCGRDVGGTPGCANSLWSVSGSFDFETDVKAFDPVREKVTITYDIPLKSSLRIRAYNLEGLEMATILDHDSPQTGTIEWNGKKNGENLPIGMYILVADTEPDGERQKLSIAIVRENR